MQLNNKKQKEKKWHFALSLGLKFEKYALY